MSITITGAEREALWEEFVVMLTGVDALVGATVLGRFDRAAQLGLVYSDALTLVVTDLGWGPGSGKSIELKTDEAIVRRVMGHFRAGAGQWRRLLADDAEELARQDRRSHALDTTCYEIIRKLDGGSA